MENNEIYFVSHAISRRERKKESDEMSLVATAAAVA